MLVIYYASYIKRDTSPDRKAPNSPESFSVFFIFYFFCCVFSFEETRKGKTKPTKTARESCWQLTLKRYSTSTDTPHFLCLLRSKHNPRSFIHQTVCGAPQWRHDGALKLPTQFHKAGNAWFLSLKEVTPVIQRNSIFLFFSSWIFGR